MSTARSREERFRRLVANLGNFSQVFSCLSSHGGVKFDPNFPTAAICYFNKGDDRDEQFIFTFGERFFDYNSDYTNMFFICHEMLHVILKHGSRISNWDKPTKANVAADLIVNHMLVDVFGFKRCLIDDWEDFCWRDTVFHEEIEPLPTMEDYYNLPDSLFKEDFDTFLLSTFEGEDIDDETQDSWVEILHQEQICSRDEAANGFGGLEGSITTTISTQPSKKRKFESLVKNIAGSVKEEIDSKIRFEDSWSRIDRRLAFTAPDLPSQTKIFDRHSDLLIDCYVFVDYSGSCSGFAQRFINVAMGLDPSVFNVKLFSFDVAVREITGDAKSGFNIRGGGGTAFGPVIRKISEDEPDVSFILTDGEASPVKPHKFKKRTHWFITENGHGYAVRNAGKVWKLSQFD